MDPEIIMMRCMTFVVAWAVLGLAAFVVVVIVNVSGWFVAAVPIVGALVVFAYQLNVMAWRAQ